MELTTPLTVDGYVLDEPKGVLSGLKPKDFNMTRAERIALLTTVREPPAVKSVRKEVPQNFSMEFQNPHTEEFCNEWGILGRQKEAKGKERAFPLNPLEQPGIFERMRPIYNKLKSRGDIPNQRPDITFANEQQNEILEAVKKEWRREQPDLAFPTNFFLNFWQLMQCNTSFESKKREEIAQELQEFATQNQQTLIGKEEHSYNAESLALEERPLKRRAICGEPVELIDLDQPD